jgi:predicted SAM-dependent methyltransferase
MTNDLEYYSSCDQVTGFKHEGYRNFPGNSSIAMVLSTKNPTSVIDFGGARGYTEKTLTDLFNIPATVMEKSLHCYHTRAVKDFVVHDMYDFPYPFADKQFDLAYSNSVLEHIDYENLDDVIREMARVSKRGYHAIGFVDETKDYNAAAGEFFSDGTHIIYEKRSWWEKRFKDVVPGYDVEMFNAYDDNVDLKVPMIKNEYVSLNLGCGTNIFASGWINVDRTNLAAYVCKDPYKFKIGDINTRFPYEDNTCDFIFLGNVLETMNIEQGMELIKECRRVLKPGGLMRIAVIDAEFLMRKYLNEDLDFLKHIHAGAELAPCPIIKLSYALFNGAGAIYDKCLLREVLKRSGFVAMTETNAWDSTHHFMAATTCVSYPTISLCMEVKK